MFKFIDILVLGAGWTSTFLIPLCRERRLSFAATTRQGSDSTIKFEYIPDSDDWKAFEVLPTALTVLITFPIKQKGASQRLVRMYMKSRRSEELEQGHIKVQFIQLGTTSIWGVSYMFH